MPKCKQHASFSPVPVPSHDWGWGATGPGLTLHYPSPTLQRPPSLLRTAAYASSGSPFAPVFEAASHERSFASGLGVEGGSRAVAGRAISFTIHARDMTGNPLDSGGDPFRVTVKVRVVRARGECRGAPRWIRVPWRDIGWGAGVAGTAHHLQGWRL